MVPVRLNGACDDRQGGQSGGGKGEFTGSHQESPNEANPGTLGQTGFPS